MELRQLHHFVAVAEEQQFTRAARRINIVQSALSGSIRSLERELRARLFLRTTRRVQLTPAGRAFLGKVREALAAIETARELVSEIEGLKAGSLAIGTVHSLPAFLDLPSLIARFHETNPGVEVRLRQGDAPGLLEQLRRGLLDLAFLPLIDPPGDMVTRMIACEDLVAVVPDGHPLAGAETVDLADLRRHPFVDFDTGWGTRALVDRAFARAGLIRHTAFEVTDLGTLVDLVARGLGVALVPEGIAETRPRGIAVAGVAMPEICWELVVAHLGSGEDADQAPINRAARAFLDLLPAV